MELEEPRLRSSVEPVAGLASSSRPTIPWRACRALVLVSLLVVPCAVSAASSASHLPKKLEIPEGLPSRHQAFLLETAVLLTEQEVEVFLAQRRDYQRDAFIERFWRERDPFPDTARNEMRRDWDELVLEARSLFGDLLDVRSQFLLLNGRPTRRVEVYCRSATWPLEVWFYESVIQNAELRMPQRMAIVFYSYWGKADWALWQPLDGIDRLLDRNGGAKAHHCGWDDFVLALEWIAEIAEWGPHEYPRRLYRLEEPPPHPSAEWVQTFESYSTDLAEDAPELGVALEVDFPGWRQGRVLVRVAGRVDLSTLEAASFAGHRSYHVEVIGEVLRPPGDSPEHRGDVTADLDWVGPPKEQADASVGRDRSEESASIAPQLLDLFRYRFDFPQEPSQAGSSADPRIAPLVFERYLRPGSYTFVLRFDDLNSDAGARLELPVEVPPLEEARTSPKRPHAAFERLFKEVDRRLFAGEAGIRLLLPHEGLVAGYRRFEALTTGENIARVDFSIDDVLLLSRREPPWTVDLDLGELPRSQVLRAAAFDREGVEIASDEMLLNASPYRFGVRLVDPVSGVSADGAVRVRVDLDLPERGELEALEIFLGDDRVATLYEPPFVQTVVLPNSAMKVVRAVGRLSDGRSAEDIAIVNGPPLLESVNVDVVELYTSVLDRERRPVEGLSANDFEVREEGVVQTIERFERAAAVPIRATLLLDVSSSMAERLPLARDAALAFFDQAIGESDRLSVILFNDRPHVATGFTNRTSDVASGLAGIRAERGTALWDSIVFSLFQSNGLEGQRALVVISDGLDESSHYDFEQALEYTKRSEATIFAVAIGLEGKERKQANGLLGQLARQTGGALYFVDEADELGAVYEQIARELRSRYLLVYQSSNEGKEGWRQIEIDVSMRGARARTLNGYFP